MFCVICEGMNVIKVTWLLWVTALEFFFSYFVVKKHFQNSAPRNAEYREFMQDFH